MGVYLDKTGVAKLVQLIKAELATKADTSDLLVNPTTEDLNGTSDWVRAKLTELGWNFGKYLHYNGNLVASADYCVSHYIPVSNYARHSLTYYYGFNSSGVISWIHYDSDKVMNTYGIMSQNNTRTANVSASVPDGYIRITLNLNRLTDCYIKDNTTGNMIWDGEAYLATVCQDKIMSVVDYVELLDARITALENS